MKPHMLKIVLVALMLSSVGAWAGGYDVQAPVTATTPVYGTATRDDCRVEDQVRRCSNDRITYQTVIGYIVHYTYDSRDYISRMQYDPGEMVNLRVNVSVLPGPESRQRDAW